MENEEKEIQVTVFCLTFNHEKYVRKCLDGFLMQRTAFPFEVIVHDDASTDGTQDILREYAARYPELIKPILQTVNQWSQGIDSLMTHIAPRARGRFFAFCEGDDCWTDPLKLQKQYDFLAAHGDYAICVHRAVWHNMLRNEDTLSFPAVDGDRDFTIEEIIVGGGGIFATNSAMVRREAYIGMPDCFSMPGVSDYQIFMYAAICGRCRCLADVMSVYNYATENSWTLQVSRGEASVRLRHNRALAHMLHAVDDHYGGRYHDAFEKALVPLEFVIAQGEEDYREALRPRYRALRKRGGLRLTLYFFLRAYCPAAYVLYRRLKAIFHGTEQ